MLVFEYEASNLFHTIHTNGSNEISHKEVKHFLQGSDWAMTFVNDEAFHWPHLWSFATNGCFDEHDFVKMYLAVLRPWMTESLFRALDSKGTGMISSSEFHRGMAGKRKQMLRGLLGGAGRDWQEILADIDTNGDGQVSIDELEAAIARFSMTEYQ